jgi:undecaprenyl-diphosphatase
METFYYNEIIVSILNHWANLSLYFSNLVVFAGVYLGWMMLLFLLIYIYRAHRKWPVFRFVLIAVASALISLLIADLIKYFFPIGRPTTSLGDITQIFIPIDAASFPSSHMTFFSGLAFALIWRKRQLGFWFLIGAILIGVARIAAGVHYPLDIVAGALLGFIVSLFSHRWLGSKSYLR